MATLSFSSVSTTSLTARVSGLDTNFAYARIFYWYANGVSKGSSTTLAGASSVSKSITGLSPNTSYTISVEIYNKDLGNYLTSLSGSVKTESEVPQNPAENATLSISGIGRTYLTANISNLIPSETGVRIEFYANSTLKHTIFTKLSATSADITDLSSGTSYTIQAKIYDNNTGALLKTLSVTTTTDSNPKLSTPTLDTTATIKTANSISVTSNPVSNATIYYFRINGGTIINNGSLLKYTFTELVPNTQYYIEIKVGSSGYEDSNWVGYYATTLVAENWQWTTTEINAFNNKGLITALTYQRWNAFVDKIYEANSNNWWTSSTEGANLSYALTKMTSTDNIITADRFNSVRYNIGSRITTSIVRVYKDDIMYGSYFITLGNKLNEWIQST